MRSITFIIFVVSTFLFVQNIDAQSLDFQYDLSGNCKMKYKTIVLNAPAAAPQNNSIQDTIQAETQKGKIGNSEVLIYPNPTKGQLKVEILGDEPEQAIIYTLTDLAGKILLNFESKSTSTLINMSSLAEGIYILNVSLNGKQDQWKIIKK